MLMDSYTARPIRGMHTSSSADRYTRDTITGDRPRYRVHPDPSSGDLTWTPPCSVLCKRRLGLGNVCWSRGMNATVDMGPVACCRGCAAQRTTPAPSIKS